MVSPDIFRACFDQTNIGMIGDIKPGNILLYKDTDGKYTAKVTDFGYSTVFADEENSRTITIRRSRPWTAPEYWDGRMFTFTEAKATDIYSFGLFCLWLLFFEKIADMKAFRDRTGCLSLDNPWKEDNMVEDLKEDGSILHLALSLVLAEDCPQQSNLAQLFKLTLDRNAEVRCNDLATLMPLLGERK